MKTYLLIVAAVAVVLFVIVGILARFVYPDNIAETSENHEDGELKTRVYGADLQTVFDAVKQIVPTLSTYGSSWKLIDAQIEDESATVKTEVPVIGFTDDLSVNIRKFDGKTSVSVRSNSRVGKSDFGENRRHVVKLLNALDEKLAADK